MAEVYFNEVVGIKQIFFHGRGIVRFVLDENLGGFLFTRHKIRKLEVPFGAVGPAFVGEIMNIAKMKDTSSPQSFEKHGMITFKEPIKIKLTAVGEPLKKVARNNIK
jgi:hypothetical protein|tara:strand:+ start:93 stop:413 length:321 start_codon:yes stop_codon:yes gene_type:complete